MQSFQFKIKLLNLIFLHIVKKNEPGTTKKAQQIDPTKPVKYGDVFQVSGDLASEAVEPKDAAAAQAAECILLGHTQKGGPAAVMQSAADVNLSRGVVGREDVTEGTREHGVTITLEDVGGQTVATEAVAEKVVGKFVVTEEETKPGPQLSSHDPVFMTIGQALESVAVTAGDKPVDEADAAAIQVAEILATGRNQVIPGGVTATAQSAAKTNARTAAEDKKIKLRDVLNGATTKLQGDKPVTKEDVDAMVGAEIRNRQDMATYPGGVAASVAAALRANQQQT